MGAARKIAASAFASLLVGLGIVTAPTALAAPPWPVAAPWEAGKAAFVGGAGYFYGEGDHVGTDYYAVDINGPGGGDTDCLMEIRATADGTVEAAGDSGTGYGNQVLLNHGDGYTSRYAHLYDWAVEQGASVVRGQAIGRMGTTGESDYCHLHFVLYENGQSVPPSPMSGVDLDDGVSVTSDNDPESAPADAPPSGELTEPAGDSTVRPGHRIRVAGSFTDDRGVAEVEFLVADDTLQLKSIGSDTHSGNGEYGVYWRVDYPVGANLHFRARVVDSAGNEGTSVVGIDDVRVTPAVKRHKRVLTFSLENGGTIGTGKVEITDGYEPCREHVRVLLQRRAGKKWRIVEKTRSTDERLFIFDIPDGGGVFRAHAPKLKLGDYSQHVCLPDASRARAVP